MSMQKSPACILFAVSLVLFLAAYETLFCLPEADHKGLFDFDVTLKEWDSYVKTNQLHRINKDRLLLLNGVFAEVSPRSSRQNLFIALIKEHDLLRPQAFIQKIQAARTPLLSWLKAGLTEETKSLLADYRQTATSVPAQDLIRSLLRDLEALMSRQGLFAEKYLTDLSLSQDLREWIKLQPKGREEQAFLNRLIMEEVFSEELARFQVRIELVKGEWLGLEDVKSYRATLLFSGTESFKVFHRLRVTEASPQMIALNVPVLVVARPFKLVTDEQGEKSYLLKGVFIRALQG